MTPERLSKGYVIILPGVEGRSFWNQCIINGLQDAKIPYAIERHDWTLGRFRFFHNLRSARRHDVQSRWIAHKIARYRKKHPSQPVYLIGHSGGGAMALLALKNLPMGVTATGAVLLSNAMSPGFDLSQSLQKSTVGIWNFSSYFDAGFVGIGTFVFGTVDGKHTLSSGMVGFRTPDSSEDLQGTLIEVPYNFGFARYLNLGGHFGCTSRPFIKNCVAPLLINPLYIEQPIYKLGASRPLELGFGSTNS